MRSAIDSVAARYATQYLAGPPGSKSGTKDQA